MNYIKLTIQLTDEYQEPLIAELLELGFDGFEQFDTRMVTYISKSEWNDVHREWIEQLLFTYPGDNYIETEEIEDQNWNQSWEQSVQPLEVGPFLIKPTWSETQGQKGQILLQIDPKMSFGTGSHATTQLMLRSLEDLGLEGKKIVDVGTGTGILAIASIKLGAQSAVALDIDEWCVKNTHENAINNQVSRHIRIIHGGIERLSEDEKFDVLLANINRNIILDLFDLFVERLYPGGDLCVTGLLEMDREAVIDRSKESSVTLTGEQNEGEWIMLRFKKAV